MPNHVLMEQKKFVKFGLTTENFRRYVGLIRDEVREYMNKHVYANNVSHPTVIPWTGGGSFQSQADAVHCTQTKTVSAGVDAFEASSEITICTASATLQGREVRAAMDKSFAQLYHDLDGGFTPLVSLVIRGDLTYWF